MKNSEEAIEKVLAGLRDVGAPQGMEGRILNGLEERAGAQSRSVWRQLLPIWLVAPGRPVAMGTLAGGFALAGLIAVALAIPAIRRLGHAPVQAKRDSAYVESSTLAGTSKVAAESAGLASSRSGVRSTGKTMEERRTNAESAEAVLDGDSVALDAMHAASRPAPPMPLTEQERLLLRIVHKDDPVELAMLDSVLDSRMRALQDSEDKAEFQSFFGQSAKQTAPEQTMTEQTSPQQSATEQAVPGQSTTEQAMPAQSGMEQASPEQRVQEQTAQPSSTPEKFAPDQSTTQQTAPRPMRTGDNQ